MRRPADHAISGATWQRSQWQVLLREALAHDPALIDGRLYQSTV
jgi:hypothetical protein